LRSIKLFLVAIALASPAHAITTELVAQGFSAPLDLVNAHDGSHRLFVAEQGGLIRIVQGSAAAPAPFLDLSSLVVTGGERGLLGVAFHPDYRANGRFFVDYTRAGDGATVIAEYRVSTDPQRADPASARVLLVIPQPFENHNGGALRFGPDGLLYIGMGDGGSANDPGNRAQDTAQLLGKILRIDVDTTSAPYGIPSDNPFVTRAGTRPEIWLYGLRNPWRTSFDRATGDFWIGDVGASSWEEVDVIRSSGGGHVGAGGLNLGWDVMEGAHCTDGSTSCATDGLTLPVTEYGHDQGCTVIGGAVYRGAAQPALSGIYVFDDACSGTVFAIDAKTSALAKPTIVGTFEASSVSFGEDQAGELYVANLDGAISRVIASR
jgi:glucose/arabinose dehydrogenase